MKTFPIQRYWPERDFPPQRKFIPCGLIEPHEKQALANHADQTLVRLADRCGLCAMEAVAVIEDKRYRERWPGNATKDQQLEAINRLDALCREFEAIEHEHEQRDAMYRKHGII